MNRSNSMYLLLLPEKCAKPTNGQPK